MIDTAQIPDEVVEAGARAIEKSLKTARITLESEDGYKPEARAAFLAMLEAWEVMQHDNYVIVLPLPTEASDD